MDAHEPIVITGRTRIGSTICHLYPVHTIDVSLSIIDHLPVIMPIDNSIVTNEQTAAQTAANSLLLRMNLDDEIFESVRGGIEDTGSDDEATVQGNGNIDAERLRMDQRYQDVLLSNILPGTRAAYQLAVAKFLLWLFGNERQAVLHPDVIAELTQEAAKEHPKLLPVAKDYIRRTSRTYHPIDLGALENQDFVNFLLSITPDKEFLSKSSYGNYRSGLFNQFRESGQLPTADFSRDLEQSFAGLKRISQRYKANKGGKLGEGKQPLPFPLYQKLCEWMIEDGSKEALFSWAFLTLTWNLICRSKNTTSIHRNHISWENDSLVIQFAHQKTDMLGNNEAVKRHVFANPKEPTICPVLALSVYLAVTPTREMGMLFRGNNQYERFRKNLLGLVGKNKDEIISMGIDPGELGVHSIRKGAATYACSGTTCSPSIGAVCNRAGWTMGQVKDIYMRYEAAQDQYVGRIVAGLNIHSFEFSVSPPYFQSSEVDNTIVKEDMKVTFPFVIEIKHFLVMRFCLASLFYSKDFLLEKLGNESPLRSICCLRPGGINSQIRWVRTKFAHEDVETQLKICGIPPHVVQLEKLEQIRQVLATSTREHHASIVSAHEELLRSFRHELDSRSIGGGQITVSRIEDMIKPVYDRLEELLAAPHLARTTAAMQEPLDVSHTNTGHRKELYQWGDDNRLRRLPENYKICMKMTVLAVWQLWHHGDEDCFPFKTVEPIDVCDVQMVNGRKRPKRDTEIKKLGHMRYLCRALDEAIGRRVVNRASRIELITHYSSSDALRDVLPSQETPCNRVRRAEELNWMYASKVMRKQKNANTSL